MARCDSRTSSHSTVPQGRRDRWKAEARQRLLSAAGHVIAESGVSDLRISDVTGRADLGFGTFYTYFACKDALIEAVVEGTLRDVAAGIGSEDFDDPAEAAAVSYRRFLRFSRDEPQLVRVLVELDRSTAIFEAAVGPWATKTLVRGKASGRFAIEDIELCLTSVTGAAFSAIRAVLDGRISAGERTESLGAEMMLRSLGLDSASARDLSRRELSALGTLDLRSQKATHLDS